MLNGLTKSAKLKSYLSKTFGIEEVFVIPAFDADTIPNGFTSKKRAEAKGANLELRSAKFVLRSDAEQDIVFKQIIPMTVIKDSYQNYFVIEFDKPRKDARLKGTKSILIGGHINPVDGYTDNFEKCLARHLKYSTTFKSIPFFGRSFYGYLKDDKSDLADHIGYIYFTTITNCYKSLLETRPSAGITGSWMSKDQLMSSYNDFDSWGRLIISHIVYGERKDNYTWKPQQKSVQTADQEVEQNP